MIENGLVERARRHPVVFGVAVWLLMGAAAGAVIWNLNTSERSLGARLSESGVTTLGTVTGTDPGNHNSVLYSYEVDGTTYHDGYFGHGPEGDASDLSVGDRIHVIYDSEDPETSCYCELALLAKRRDWWRALLAGLFLASVASVGLTLAIVRSDRVTQPVT